MERAEVRPLDSIAADARYDLIDGRSPKNPGMENAGKTTLGILDSRAREALKAAADPDRIWRDALLFLLYRYDWLDYGILSIDQFCANLGLIEYGPADPSDPFASLGPFNRRFRTTELFERALVWKHRCPR